MRIVLSTSCNIAAYLLHLEDKNIIILIREFLDCQDINHVKFYPQIPFMCWNISLAHDTD